MIHPLKYTSMKAIDIQAKKALHQKALDVLDLITYAKRRIETTKENQKSIWWRRVEYEHRLEIQKKVLARVEAYYHKIVSQL